MKKTYLSPCIEVLKVTPMQIIATSTVNITVENETFDGEGRVKGSGKWYDSPFPTSIWEDDWSKQ